MKTTQDRKGVGRTIVLIVLVAAVTAVSGTLVQDLVLGHSSAAVTSSVVSVITLAVSLSAMRKRPEK